MTEQRELSIVAASYKLYGTLDFSGLKKKSIDAQVGGVCVLVRSLNIKMYL